uniref:HWE histidine kinase domain-containing protein n=1 Tax=Altererythrobacter segetis TaxID=1104773 RepID=UPI001407F6E3|nr:HWE histidine kinase domain-containing protein [Altererythrobacter segetis]
MLARHTFVGSLGWSLIAVVIPAVLRLVLDAGRYGTPFVTFYPAVVLSALFLGWRYSVLTTILCAAAARLLFMQDLQPLGSTPEGLAIFVLFVFSCGSLIAIGEWLRRVLVELDAASAREALLNQELRHRLKNLLAVVNSLSALSHRHSDPEEAQSAFAERLAALDRATSLLGGDGAVSCALPELAEEALRPFLSDYDIRLTGAPQEVDRDGCVPAVLALHELATNAIKYGSLSAAGGWVDLRWDEPADGRVTLHWQESGGPPVAKPQHRGMGSRILSMHSLAATFDVAYPEDGVRCELELKAL